MVSYWADGPTDVSIRDICERAGVSKPGLYREFGGDDALKTAVLDLYQMHVLTPFHDMLASDLTFEQMIDHAIVSVVQDRQGLPNGCLYVSMYERKAQLGQHTRQKVEDIQKITLRRYEEYIERAKSKLQFRKDISSPIAAIYLDAQMNSALRMQKEGVSRETISDFLRFALSQLQV